MPRREKVHENEPFRERGTTSAATPLGGIRRIAPHFPTIRKLPAFQGAHPNPSTDNERERSNKQPTHTEDVIVHRMQYGTRYPRVEMRKDTAPDIVRRNLGQTAATHEMDSGRSGYGTPQQTAERLRPGSRNAPDWKRTPAIESTSLCLPTLNSRSCDAGCEATATDRFTADDAEAVTSPPPDRTAIQASNMVSHLCIESKDNEKSEP